MTQIDTGELKAIARRNYNRIPPTRGDSTKSYFHEVLMWLAEWSGVKKVRQTVAPGYCAFVLAPEIVSGDVPQGAEKLSFFKEDQTPLLGGNIYLTGYAINQVFRYPGTCGDLDETIRMLEEKGISDLPFVAFDTDSQTVYVFAEGGEKMTWRFPLRVDLPRPFTIDV